jgi:hypothetical protein
VKKFTAGAGVILLSLMAAMPLRALSAAAPLAAASLYNQGNAYARAGKPGMAVLNYERAQLLSPGDSDLEANLDAVRTAQHLPVEPRAWPRRLAMLPNPTVAGLLGMLGLVCLGLSVVVGRRLTQSRRATLAAAALSVSLMALAVGQAAILWPLLHAGVIIAHEAPVLVSPVPMGEALFVLSEAETVTLTAEHEDYILIKTGTGRVGWVLGTNLARVVAVEH